MIGRCWGLSVWAEGMRVSERKGERERGLHAGMWGGAGEEERLWSGLGPVRNESLISLQFCGGWLITGLQRSRNKALGR